jgi:3-phenylpropionate/cinnamic acid dioxygenase small subunit
MTDAKQRGVLRYNYEISLLRLDRNDLLKTRDTLIKDEKLKENRAAYVYEHAMNNVRIAAIDNQILRCEIEINYLMDG